MEEPHRSRRALRARARGALVLAHVLGLALFLGGTAAVLLVVSMAEAADQRVFGFEIALALQRYVLLPGAIAIALSGVALGFVGPFGFLRHWWMAAKLAGSLVLTMHSQVEYRPLTATMLASLREAAGAIPEGWADALFHYQRVGFIQIGVLVLLSALGILKPFGRTSLGKRKRPTAPTVGEV